MPNHRKKAGRYLSDSRAMCYELAKSGISLPLIFTPQFIACDDAFMRIIRGESDIKPHCQDSRFRDPIWHKNTIYKASMQAYLNWCDTLKDHADNTESNNHHQQLSEAVAHLTQTLAPTKNPGNSTAQHAYKSRGASLIHDLHRMTTDLLRHTLPQPHSTKSVLKIGKQIAATAGAVIHHTNMLELIQYTPITAQVHKKPLLIIPSPVNRFYLCDLREKNSLVHYLLKQGFQVYCLSWRNPQITDSHWNLECYAQETLAAIKELSNICEHTSINLMGFSTGGMLTAIASSLLAQQSTATHTTNPVNSATFAISSLKTHTDSQVGSRLNAQLIQAAQTLALSHKVTDAKELARNFAWLCPNQLLWNPLVSNYFHGEASADDDLFYWNNDTLRITAGLYCDFLSMINDNPLLEDNKLSCCGEALDLSAVQCDTYTLAGSYDHITPWEACYQSCHALGGNREFVLVNRGHSRALVCPIGATDSCYYTHSEISDNHDDWLCDASQHNGSWWPHWADWLAKRSGELLIPQRQLGDQQHPKECSAPGRYVLE